MVGHSGKIEPTVKAVETVDACLAQIDPLSNKPHAHHADHQCKSI